MGLLIGCCGIMMICFMTQRNRVYGVVDNLSVLSEFQWSTTERLCSSSLGGNGTTNEVLLSRFEHGRHNNIQS